METITKLNYVLLLNLSNEELVQEVKDLIESATIQSNKYDWQIKGNIKITDKEILELIKKKREVSTNSFKDFICSLYRASIKQTKRSFNSFFSKLPVTDKIKIETGAKEKTIQDKRKKWLVAREIAEAARLEYRLEKCDFYKNIIQPSKQF